jgi:hypothetical protein
VTYPQQYQQGYPGAQAYAPPPQAPQYAPPGYPAPGYAPPYQPPQPPPDLPRGTVSDFYDQPGAGGGPGLKFEHPGQRYVGVVARNVTNADIHPQTKMRPRPGEDPVDRHPDGRVKQQMWIPLLVAPSAQFPQGEATWYVKSNERTELHRAMEAAGAPIDPDTGRLLPPRAGDTIDVAYAFDKPGRPGMNATKVKQVTYTVGNGTLPPPEQVPQLAYAQQPAPQYQPQQYAQLPQPPQLPQGAYYDPSQAPAQAYQQATGQPMPPQYAQQGAPPPPQGPYGQPNADWNPYAQAPPTQAAPAVSAQPPVTAAGMVSASPSSAGAPPAEWPADVPFIPGLTVDQARTAQAFKLAQGQR